MGARQFIDFHVHLDGEKILDFIKVPGYKFLARKIPLFDEIIFYFTEFSAHHFRSQKLIPFYNMLNYFATLEISRRLLANSVNDLIHSMDKNDIKISVIHAIEPYLDTSRILNLISEYKERLLVFCSINFKEPDCLKSIEGYLQLPVVGLKIYPAVQKIDPREAIVFNILQIAQERKIPVFFHSGSFPFEIGERTYNDVNLLEPLLSQFSELKIILGHIGWDQYEKTIKLAKDHKNVFVETSWQPSKIIRKAIDELGPERVVFGSDWPLEKQSSAIKHLKNATKKEEFEQIIYKNAINLLKLE